MTKLRHGYRTYFENLASDIRQDLNLYDNSPICPRLIAQHLDIPVTKLSSLGLDPEVLNTLSAEGTDKFFGCVLPIGKTRKGILHNDSVSPKRQNSDIAHEIAHIILGHPLVSPTLGDGKRSYNSTHEHEARELGMTLLLPKKAALKIAMSSMSPIDASNEYFVSRSLLSYRLKITNAQNWAYNKKRNARRW